MNSTANGATFQSRPIAMGRRGAVSTPHGLASRAAIEVLMAGGNAVDGAVAAAAVAAVVQPFSSGIGGGGWATVYDQSSKTTEVLEFHGRVPEGVRPEQFSPDPVGIIDWPRLEAKGLGLLGSLVPGVVAGWEALLRRRGRLSLAQALAPAITHALDGFPVSELLHASIVANADRLRRWPSSADTFLKDGRPYAPGEILVQSKLGATLKRIARNGSEEIRTGETASALAKFYQDNGGALDTADLASYQPSWHQPLSAEFRGYIVKGAPAPLGDLSFMQGLLFHAAAPRFKGPLDPDYIHTSVESAKLVRTDRARHLGDNADPSLLERLLTADHIRARSALIGATARPVEPDEPAPAHTITLAVVDSEGNAVHLMQTVGVPFGTGAVAGDTGIVTNSSLYFAHSDPARPNGVRPGRRLEQNPCVVLVFDPDGRLFMLVGSPGGKTRVETVRQMIVNVLDFGMNIQQAIDAPRFLTSPDGRSIEFETGLAKLAPDLVNKLEARGHRLQVTPRHLGTGQAVLIDPATETRMGGADWRQEAMALAF